MAKNIEGEDKNETGSAGNILKSVTPRSGKDFALGAAAGVLLVMMAPAIWKALRPVLVRGIKQGIQLGTEMKALKEEVEEEMQEMVAEAITPEEGEQEGSKA